MDKVYIVETTHENGEKERREVEATHIIEAFQKGTYDCYATMVIVKEKVSRDYKAEIAYLTAENERLRGEVEEQKSIAEHEHASQMEWFSIAGDYKAENAELRKRLDKAIEPPVKIGDKKYTPDCRGTMVLEETVVGVRLSYDKICGACIDCVETRTQEDVLEQFTYVQWRTLYDTREAAEARLKEIQEKRQ